jgi:PleD family two-component response regulator
VRTLTELHGGSVTAHSDGRNRGSEFVVRLPASAPGAAIQSWPTPPSGTRARDIRRRATRILVVDDNVDVVCGFARALSLAGFETQTATGAAQAMALAEVCHTSRSTSVFR